MKAQFKKLQAEQIKHYNNTAAPHALASSPTKQETKLQAELNELEKANNLLQSNLSATSNNYQNLLNQLTQVQAQVNSLQQENNGLKTVIDRQKTELSELTKHQEGLQNVSQGKIHQLEKDLSEKEGVIKGLQESLKLIISQQHFVSLDNSSLDLNGLSEQEHEAFNLNAMQTVESILVEQPSQSIEQVQVSYGVGMSAAENSQQLLGNASNDFSIIDHDA